MILQLITAVAAIIIILAKGKLPMIIIRVMYPFYPTTKMVTIITTTLMTTNVQHQLQHLKVAMKITIPSKKTRN